MMVKPYVVTSEENKNTIRNVVAFKSGLWLFTLQKDPYELCLGRLLIKKMAKWYIFSEPIKN